MGLYNRDYARQVEGRDSIKRSDTAVVAFVKETYKLFAASMMAGATGAYVGQSIIGTLNEFFIPLIILEFALLFGVQFAKNKPGLNLVVLFSFVFLTGLTTAPLIYQTLSMSNGASIVGNAFAMTSVVFGGMSLFGIKTKTDFSSYTKPLMFALIAIIIFSLINVFFLHNPIFSVAISGIVVLLFSVMVVVDTQNIIKGNYQTPIDGALALYLDFLNIFISLLQIFGFLNSED